MTHIRWFNAILMFFFGSSLMPWPFYLETMLELLDLKGNMAANASKKLAELIPSLIQIDSYMIKHDTQYQALDMAKLKKGPPKLGVAMTPDRIRQMQLEVMKRAQAETRNQHLK